MEMLFTINTHPYNLKNNNTNVKSFSLFQIPNQESKPRQEEIDVVSETNDVLPPSDDDSDDEVDVVDDLRVDNVIQNSEHKYSESEDSDLDNPLLPLPPPEPPDKELDFETDFEKEISDYLPKIEDFLCRILSWFSRPPYPLLDSSLGKSLSVIYIAYSLFVPPLCSKI
uniref:Reverse transcriptase domain-containing protein n=1 Tax=Tanacetum cinerariifolium TaxID=118510 RepID=A0A6L2LBF9_TANCI|nr:hypothetical protein [Tanacetum cinerariifolium]